MYIWQECEVGLDKQNCVLHTVMIMAIIDGENGNKWLPLNEDGISRIGKGRDWELEVPLWFGSVVMALRVQAERMKGGVVA
jgi:hypothetical protein